VPLLTPYVVLSMREDSIFSIVYFVVLLLLPFAVNKSLSIKFNILYMHAYIRFNEKSQDS